MNVVHVDVDNQQRDIASDSPYYTLHNIGNILSEHKNKFSVISLNCQSINAKYDSLLILIKELRDFNFKFSAICLQESWLDDKTDLSVFQIEHYNCISKPKYCSNHGGLIVYLHEKYDNSVNTEPESGKDFLFTPRIQSLTRILKL